MKKSYFLILLMLLPLFMFSTSYHTIAIDGVYSGWAADETFDNISHGDGYSGVKHANFTWDADYFYIAVQDDDADFNNMATFVYFDTDPSDTLGTTDAYAWGDYIVTPFKADYVVVWKNKYDNDYIEVKKYNNTNQTWDLLTSSNLTYIYDDPDTLVKFAVIDLSNTREIKIKRSLFDNPDAVKTCMFTEQQWDSYYRYMAWPSNGWTDGNRAYGQGFSNYYGFLLEDNVSPYDPPYYDGSFTEWTGATDNNWSGATNWTLGTPADTSLAIIPAGSLVNVDATNQSTYNLTIKTGAVVNINENKSLTIKGSFNNTAGSSGVVVKSSATGNGSLIVEGTSNAEVTAECYVVANKWHSFATPVSGQTTTQLFLNHNPDVWLKEYHEATNDYTNITSLTQPLGDMQGWMLWLGGTTNHTFSFAGPLRNDTLGSDNNMVRSASGDVGYNFVGNPFTSAIDWDAANGIEKTNLNNAIYVYNNTGGSSHWATYISGTGVNGGSRYIAMNQGFFVEVADNGGTYPEYGILKISKAACVHNTVPFYKSGSQPDDKILRLQVEDNEMKDETVVRIADDATADFDGQLDAHKIMSFGNGGLYIFSTDNNKMSINSVPPGTESIPMDVIGVQNHTLTISLTEGQNDFEHVLLTDLKEDITTDLTGENYSFNYTSGFANRFVLHFIITGIDNESSKNIQPYYAFANNKIITIDNSSMEPASIMIYNLMGQTIYNGKINGKTQQISVSNTGYYLVKVFSEKHRMVKKVWVQ